MLEERIVRYLTEKASRKKKEVKKTSRKKGVLYAIRKRLPKRLKRLIRCVLSFLKKIVRKLIKPFKPLVFNYLKLFVFYRNIKYKKADEKIIGFTFLKIKSIEPDLIIKSSSKSDVFIASHLGKEDYKRVEVKDQELYLTELKNVIVAGESDIILDEQNQLLVCIEEKQWKRVDFTYEDILWNHRDYAVLANREIKNTTIDRAIHLLRRGNSNYYHFMIETLSRLVLVDENEQFRTWPILVDSVVKDIPSFYRALEYVNIYNHPIIWVDKNEYYRVEKLIFGSSAISMPINLKAGIYFRTNDYIVSEWLIKKLQDRFVNHIEGDDEIGKKYVVSRKNTTNSRLINEKEVVREFVKHGYEVLCPEEYSLDEQIAIFSRADTIAACTGGAMANIIFCRPGTRVICILPDEFKFYLYSTIADKLGLKIYNVDAEVVERTRYISMDKFYLDLDEVEIV